MGAMHKITIMPIARECDHLLEKEITVAVKKVLDEHKLYMRYRRSHTSTDTWIDIINYDETKVLDINKGNLTELLRAQAEDMGISVEELVKRAIKGLVK